jgi:integrase
MGYYQKVNHFLRYCERNFFHNPLGKEALEGFLMWKWGKGNQGQTADGFRSALRKICIMSDIPDPFTKKMSLMIKNFSLDAPTKPKKFLKPSDLSKLIKVVKESKVPLWTEVMELMLFSIWQNVRISTLLEIRYNDFFPKSGSIYLVFVKGHRGPIWTILHPLSEAFLLRRQQTRKFEANDLIVGSLTESMLGRALTEMCVAAGIDLHTWHDLRHSSAQYMNDLHYRNIVSQALGCWKVDVSMKGYIRERKKPLKFSKDTRSKHAQFNTTLFERLRRMRGKMVWLPHLQRSGV